MSERTNGTLEDIGAELGFTATTALVAWFGGANLHVPETVSELHPIARVIGVKPFERLVASWGSESLWIPEAGATDERDRRDRRIAEMVLAGKGTKAIGEATGLTERRVQQIRVRLEAIGILPFVLKGTQEKAGVVA